MHHDELHPCALPLPITWNQTFYIQGGGGGGPISGVGEAIGGRRFELIKPLCELRCSYQLRRCYVWRCAKSPEDETDLHERDTLVAPSRSPLSLPKILGQGE